MRRKGRKSKKMRINRRIRTILNQKGRGLGMGVLGLALAPQILGQVSKILNVKGTF